MLITNQHKQIAQWAMEYALKNGCSAARVSIVAGVSNSVEYRNTQLDKLHQSAENKIFIELFMKGKYGSFSTNRIEKAELENFIREGVISTRFLSEDLCRQLPDSHRYYKDAGQDLDLFDNSYEHIHAEQRIEAARNAVEEVYGSNPRIVSVASSFSDGQSEEYMIASNGFEAELKDTAFSLTAEVSLKTDDDARPESYWYDSTIYWEDLQKEGISKKALERALGKIGQRKINSGKYNMLIDNTVSARLLSPVISAMYGTSLQQKNSFLLDRLDTRIVSGKLVISDAPHLKRTFGARWFDGEGVATCDNQLIEDGILKTYFIDTYNSLKMNIPPTISSPSIVTVKTGEKSFEELMKDMPDGIWVTGFNGGNCNQTTGDFSYGIEGFHIKQGKISTPVSEMNITGNILTLWSNLVAIGNDPRKNTSWKVPSLVFSDVNFSGL